MKRSVTLLIALLMLATLTAVTELAKATLPETNKISLPYKAEPPTATSQYYAVEFDREGNADVAAKLTFLNKGEEPIKKLAVEIPGTEVQLVNAVQEELRKRNESDRRYNYTPYQTLYSRLQTKAERLPESAKYEITLEQPVNAQEGGAILLHYKAKGYVSRKIFGAYEFSFESAKLDYDTDTATAAINVQKGLYMKSTNEFGTDFARPPSVKQYLASFDQFNEKHAESSYLNGLSGIIESQSGYRKRSQNIPSGASTTVKGSYATSWARLNVGKITVISLLSLLAAAGLLLGAIKLARKSKKELLIAIATGLGTAVVQLAGWAAVMFMLIATRSISGAVKLFLMLPISAAALLALLVLPHFFIGRKYGTGFGIASAATALITLAAAIAAIIIAYITLYPPTVLY